MQKVNHTRMHTHTYTLNHSIVTQLSETVTLGVENRLKRPQKHTHTLARSQCYTNSLVHQKKKIDLQGLTYTRIQSQFLHKFGQMAAH